VLADLGLKRIRLISSSDRKIVGIEGFGIEIVERVPFEKASTTPVVPLKARGREDGRP
jgi:3,4-dihydroxy 2-butanone 4-phosphate synthase / GTP cyclohydrolase II